MIVCSMLKLHTGPMICAPNSLSVFLSPRILTKPSVSLLVLALLLAANGNLPTVYSTPAKTPSVNIKCEIQLHAQITFGLEIFLRLADPCDLWVSVDN